MKVIGYYFAAIAVCVMLFFSSCQKEMLPGEGDVENVQQTVNIENQEQNAGGQAVANPSCKPIEMSESQLDMTNNLNEFSLTVFEKAIHDRPEDNFVFSPLSLAFDLGICLEGAEGETASQIKRHLGFGNNSADEINLYFQTLSEGIPTVDSLSIFTSANSLWVDKSFPIKQSFLESVGLHFAAETNNVDFTSPEAWKTINSWCNEKTNGLICEVPFDGCFQVAFVNAVTFSGQWGHAFEDELINDSFHTRASDVPATFMMSENEYGYIRMLTCRLLSIPYGSGGYSMLIAYPYDGVSFDETLTELNTLANRYLMTLVSGYLHKLKIKLPKFSIDNCEMDFSSLLKSIGIDIPFSTKADFSGISENGFSIDKVIQNSSIDVNEKGTDSASVTKIIRYTTNPGGSMIDDSEFYVDSPFMFFVMESGSGSILFAGQKVN